MYTTASKSYTSNSNLQTLEGFLESRRVYDKNKPFTHTSMDGAKYNIEDGQLTKFFDLYEKYRKQRKPMLSLVERHNPIGPILCDVDIKYNSDCDERYYSEDFISDFLDKFVAILEKYIVIENAIQRVAVVLQKDGPSQKPAGEWKDGFHVMFPFIITSPTIQYVIRRDLINDTEMMFRQLGIELTSTMNDIIDESVIERNGWMLYGCKKPDPHALPYDTLSCWECGPSSIMRIDDNEASTKYKVDFNNERKLPEILSIRRAIPGDASTMTEFGQQVVQSWNNETLQKTRAKLIRQTGKEQKITHDEDFEFAKKLANMLNTSRATQYQSWIEVGWCLHNVDYRLLETWVEFSQTAEKYASSAESECTQLWDSMKDEGLGMGTLQKKIIIRSTLN